MVPREKGTPQGGVISPLLANLFLHYAFDRWMATQYRQLPFERFADDAIVHCRRETDAQEVRAAMAARMRECGLELHPENCKDDDRWGTYPNEKFDFPGYTFRPRRSKNRKGKFFINFVGGSSITAAITGRRSIRRCGNWIDLWPGGRISRRDPKLWAHWPMGVRRGSMAGAV